MSRQSQPPASPTRPAAYGSYDEDGRPLPPEAPKKPTPTLPGSIVQFWGDDPGDWSGLRSIYDTPEARQQDPEVQARMLREYQANVGSGPIDFDTSEAERYWFGDTLGRSPWEREGGRGLVAFQPFDSARP